MIEIDWGLMTEAEGEALAAGLYAAQCEPVDCPACGGRGEVAVPIDEYGYMDWFACDTCEGRGIVEPNHAESYLTAMEGTRS